MQQITNNNLFDEIQNLIDNGKGDTGRLYFIMDSLKKQKPLYKSDQNYLDKMLEVLSFQKEAEIPKTTKDLIIATELLIQTAQGDVGRLNHIHDTLKKAKTLYTSDKNYLNEKLILLNIPQEENKTKKEVPEIKSITRLRTQLAEANKKITHLEKFKESKKTCETRTKN